MTKQSLNRQQESEYGGQEYQVEDDSEDLDAVRLPKENITMNNVDDAVSYYHATKHNSGTP